MSKYSRIAIYYTPAPEDPLYKFGAAWLGWDIHTGMAVPHPVIDGLSSSIGELISRPRKYGFHGTLKAPFRLNEMSSIENVVDMAETFCSKQRSVDAGSFELSTIGSFLAFRPTTQSEALKVLAAKVVKSFDVFRAPITDQEKARRIQSKLSGRQTANLERWGYPHVLDDFRFHMTLTSPLEKEVRDYVEHHLRHQIDALLNRPWNIDALTICGERMDGKFETIQRIPFEG